MKHNLPPNNTKKGVSPGSVRMSRDPKMAKGGSGSALPPNTTNTGVSPGYVGSSRTFGNTKGGSGKVMPPAAGPGMTPRSTKAGAKTSHYGSKYGV